MRKLRLSQVKEFAKISMDLNPELAANPVIYPLTLADVGDTAVCDNCGWQSRRLCQPNRNTDFSLGAPILKCVATPFRTIRATFHFPSHYSSRLCSPQLKRIFQRRYIGNKSLQPTHLFRKSFQCVIIVNEGLDSRTQKNTSAHGSGKYYRDPQVPRKEAVWNRAWASGTQSFNHDLVPTLK